VNNKRTTSEQQVNTNNNVNKGIRVIKDLKERNKKKLRPYKVRRKKKKPLNGYIERRKYTFDKKGERKRKVKR